jgi:hypothetical protein
MYTKDSGAIESPERRNESDSNSSCPQCDGPLSGIDTRGRGRHEAEPCGCSVSDAHLKPRVAADGGQKCDGIKREDIRLEIQDGTPVLVVGDVEILLRTFLETDDESYSAFGEHVHLRAEIDTDMDNGS